ncbi:hypothetical protein Hanom_Chr08g00745151 [Helianthus anomalus]
MREWRTMHRKHAQQEVYRSRLAVDANIFEKAKAALAQVSTKTIADLSSQNEELTKSKTDFEERYEAAKMHRERAEQNQEELRQLLVSKDRDMAIKDVEISELKHRLRESQEKVDSLEIDIEAEMQKAEMLNLVELDQTVAAFTVAARHMDHREGYTECASHVEAALKFKGDNSHCSTSVEVETIFAKTQESYNHLALPIMDLVSDALQHDDYVTRLKSILKVHGDEDFGFDYDEDEEGVGEAV